MKKTSLLILFFFILSTLPLPRPNIIGILFPLGQSLSRFNTILFTLFPSQGIKLYIKNTREIIELEQKKEEEENRLKLYQEIGPEKHLLLERKILQQIASTLENSQREKIVEIKKKIACIQTENQNILGINPIKNYINKQSQNPETWKKFVQSFTEEEKAKKTNWFL